MADCDVVVVGAGLAGLVCAAYLGQAGKRVTVLEQNHQAGGNMAGFYRGNYYFDGGLQSVESLGILFPVLREIGVREEEDWERIRFRLVSPDFDFAVSSLQTAREALTLAFPAEPALGRIFDEIQEVSRFLNKNFAPWRDSVFLDPTPAKLLRLGGWMPRLLRWIYHSYRRRLMTAIRDPGLRHWMSEIGYSKMPFLVFAGFWHLWANDYWYPRRGMKGLMDGLVQKVETCGGTVRYRTSVARILVEAGRARGVVTDQGETLRCRYVVHAADYRSLLQDMLPAGTFPRGIVRSVLGGRLTEGIVSLYLGLEMHRDQLLDHMRSPHVFYFPSYKVVFPHGSSPQDVHRSMWLFGSSPGAQDGGRSSMVLQTFSSVDWNGYWRNGNLTAARTQQYRELKTRVANQILETATRIVPDLEKHVRYRDLGTPLSLHRFTRNAEGSTGGWCYDAARSVPMRRPWFNLLQTPVKNLYAAGHYTVWPGGAISAAISARMVARLIIGRR